jgi:crotonobetainyl-CoA:carnitine CoA-transferase CaiB-like acyl-CoA transferase
MSMSASQQQEASPGALENVLVVELGARIGAAVCGSLLAQLGARVIAIEIASGLPGFDKSGHRGQLCPGKFSIAPDLEDEDERRMLRKMIARSDILLMSGDIDLPAIRALVPERSARQVFCNVTAFGNRGPLSGEACSDAEVQALVGIMHTTGNNNGPPVPIPLPVLEYLTGMHAVGAVLAAFGAVQRGCPGQSVDMALYDTGFAAMSSFLTRNLADGDKVPTERIGNRHSLSAPWNVYRAADGWLQLCTGSDLQWRRFCALMGRLDLADDPRFKTSAARVANIDAADAIVGAWTQRHSIEECVAALNTANIPSGPIAVIDSYPREANLAHRGMVRDTQYETQTFYLPGSPFKMSRSPGRAMTNIPSKDGDRGTLEGLLADSRGNSGGLATEAALPLAGLRVIEIGHYTTAPVGARYLAGLGADVIKIEPPEGEASRAWPPIRNGQSLFYTLSNSDKRCITLDLTTAEGKASLRSLLETADVLIENLKPGTLTKRGFSPEVLQASNPRLVYCAISGFGADSLYAGRPAFDTVVQAMSGLMDLIKTGDTPLKTGISIADLMGASMSVAAILAALIFRGRTGLGQSIDLSMQDILSWSTQLAWNAGAKGSASWRVIPCSDGYALVDQASRDDTRLDRSAVVARHISAGGRAAAIKTPYEALTAEQTRERQLWCELRDARGTWPAFAVPLGLLGTPCEVKRPAPPLGSHNEEIVTSLRHRDRELAG